MKNARVCVCVCVCACVCVWHSRTGGRGRRNDAIHSRGGSAPRLSLFTIAHELASAQREHSMLAGQTAKELKTVAAAKDHQQHSCKQASQLLTASPTFPTFLPHPQPLQCAAQAEHVRLRDYWRWRAVPRRRHLQHRRPEQHHHADPRQQSRTAAGTAVEGKEARHDGTL